jgi:hypothetical protein
MHVYVCVKEQRWEVIHIYVCVHETEGHVMHVYAYVHETEVLETEGARVMIQLTQWGQRHFDFLSVGICLPKKMLSLRRNGHAKRNSLRYFSASKVERGSRYCCFRVQNTAFALK